MLAHTVAGRSETGKLSDEWQLLFLFLTYLLYLAERSKNVVLISH